MVAKDSQASRSRTHVVWFFLQIRVSVFLTWLTTNDIILINY